MARRSKIRSRRKKKKVRTTDHSGIVLRHRPSKTKGKRTRNSFRVDFTVDRPMSFNFDMRRLIELVTYEHAAWQRDKILAGKMPRGGSMPKLDRLTKEIYSKTRKGGFWVRTGKSVRAWLLEPIRGTFLRADRITRPNGGQNPWMIDQAIRQHGDIFQDVKGKEATDLIAGIVDQYMESAVGEDVDVTPPRFKGAGTLDKIPQP